MRTTIDIPDETYRELKMKAAREGKTVREIALRGIERELHPAPPRPAVKFELPIIRSNRTDLVDLDSEKVYDLIDFP
jgi:hypothetical protein